MKKVLLFTFAFIFIFLVGCSHIEDTNGAEDFSIVEISDEEILDGGSSMSVGSISSTVNGVHKLSIKKFSGVEELLEIEADSEKTIEVSIKNEVKDGNFMIVLILNDQIIKKVYANTSYNDELSFTGELEFVIVGESANFKMEYSFKEWR